MLKINPLPVEEPAVETPSSPPVVMLACGKQQDLAGLSTAELHQLQWEQEQKFAAAIRSCPARSRERKLVTSAAYDTICTILAEMRQDEGEPLSMGMDPRYARLVLQLLELQVAQGAGDPTLFEVGYGSGALLEEARGHGFKAAGIEVSPAMQQLAIERLGERHADVLLEGDIRDFRAADLPYRPTLIFWNDVFEHIPIDEIDDYAAHLYSLLPRRGSLVTITPNWLLRPSDVTADFCPPRTEPQGLHFKEYRLREVSQILRNAGFRSIATPLFATKARLVTCGGGGRWFKQLFEAHMDRLPLRIAHLLCRGFAMSCTIATK